MSEPEVTAIMLTYNRPELSRRTLRSVLAQRDVAMEVLVVDNGSTPPAAAVVDEFADERVVLVRLEQNQNPPDVRNQALAMARGTWVAYVDDDDLWAPDKLRLQIDACTVESTVWGYVGIVDIDEHDRLIRGQPPMPPDEVASALPYRCEVPGGDSGVLVRRDVLLALGGYDSRFLHSNDWDLYIRLVEHHGTPSCVSQPLVGYRLHHGQLSNAPDAFFGDVADLNAAHAHLRVGVADAAGKNAGLDEAFIWRGIAEGALRGGQRRSAVRAFIKAARGGDRRSWVLLGTVALPDRVQRQLRLRRADQEWLAQAEAWLAPLTGRA